ncbi:putative sugar-binding protein [Cricetibacter osteomyelitidis]|uniref:Putative sugar-binding protein n=1 Tax=Cricetibacter osteomyelitidis TaxID=1521931 RepID=A0A4R2SPI5_9PAST|nr:four-carbon acid sugar kinase family protein [Cricetibacter osteomyelitidis]TCP90126.1 putative sugar-binding protein [Cricetibacter osteomyelitidis]
MLVIADDFTGANDTGVLFTQNNTTVDIALNWQQPISLQSDVVVVNTDSRAVSKIEAGLRVRQVICQYHTENNHIYKKVDSTLRGNIGSELAALLTYTEFQAIFFCAALPQAGRTVHNGIGYVNNVPLLQTEFATDPKTPILSSKVAEIIAKQTALSVIEIHVEQLHSETLLSEINQIIAAHPKSIICFDARNEQGLHRIAQIPVITKAGGFGSLNVLEKVIDFIRN